MFQWKRETTLFRYKKKYIKELTNIGTSILLDSNNCCIANSAA
jgi:hypothetical protein